MAGKLAGGGGKRRKALQPNAEPNVIPFIDVMLVLLIIFMVAAPMPTVDIRVDLPANPQNIMQEGRQPTMVAIEEEGGQLVYYVDGRSVSRSELGDAVLAAAIANNPALRIEDIFREASIVFRADQDTAYANVVATMGFLQEEDWAKVSLFAERADS